MATTAISYASSQGFTITLNSLGDSATVGRQSTVIDNTSNLYDDAMVTVSLTTAGTMASPFVAYVYLFGSEDGTLYTQDDGTIGASDAAYTVNAASNLKGPFIISTPTTAKVYNGVIGSVASFFGGNMPRKWGIVVVNDSGAALSSSGNSASYTGIKTTIA